MSGSGDLLPNFMSILFFRHVSCFSGVSGKERSGNAGGFLSRFTGVHLVKQRGKG